METHNVVAHWSYELCTSMRKIQCSERERERSCHKLKGDVQPWKAERAFWERLRWLCSGGCG
eukprot:2783650-Amphidinium_carterae.1